MSERWEPKTRPIPDTAADRGQSSTSPVRIVFCITELDPGGAERALTQLVLNLNRDEWDPHVISLGRSGYFATILQSAGIPVVCLNAKNAFSAVRVLFRLTRELRRLRPAVVQTFLFHANLIGRLAARMAGVKVVVSGIRVAERRNQWHGRLDRWTNRLVTTNVCVSQGVADFSSRVVGLDPGKLIVIPNSVTSEDFENVTPADLSPFGIPPNSRVFISVGRLDRQKGFDLLIDAVLLFRGLPDDVYFLIIGDGPESERLQQQVQAARLEKHIRFGGRRRDVPRLLAAAMAFILPSRWEGMPNVVLEAMASGLPVIATQVEGISELVQHGVTGLIVAPETPLELHDAIEQILSQHEFARDAGRRSQHIIRSSFTAHSTSRAYATLYRQLLHLATK